MNIHTSALPTPETSMNAIMANLDKENMNVVSHPLVPALRSSARLLVREFGFMSSTFADTHLSPSAAHALIEIGSSTVVFLPNQTTIPKLTSGNENAGAGYGVTASWLCIELNLEKSSVSRLLRKLIEGGEIEEGISGRDGREKVLSLTSKGREILEMIDKFGNEQVERALNQLPKGTAAEMVLNGIEAYAKAMRAVRFGCVKKAENETTVEIREGYIPSLAGRVIEMHMSYYSRVVGFGAIFESLLASGLSDIILRLDGTKSQVWTTMDEGKVLGCIFIDRESKDLENDSEGQMAHLRFFIVDESLRGKGVGMILIERAMKWVDERNLECHLWTFKGLLNARKLYDKVGFILVEEGSSEKLGKEAWIQRFVRARKPLESVVV